MTLQGEPAARVAAPGAAVPALITAEGLTLRYGRHTIVENVDLAVRPGEIVTVIGPNGAGKTTLFNLITGLIPASAGRVVFDDADITGRPPHELARRDPALREPAREMLERVGLGARASAPAAILSHGEHRLLEIAMALAVEPKLLLLDEPMAGMGGADTARMVELLRTLKSRAAMLLVEHDMDAVFALADRITVLVYGQAIASGPPEEIRCDPAVRQAYLGEENNHHGKPAC